MSVAEAAHRPAGSGRAAALTIAFLLIIVAAIALAWIGAGSLRPTVTASGLQFRTIKAGLYNGRTRHYHIAVTVPGELTRYCSQLFWNETAYDLNGNTWATQNANDMVFAGITDAAQRAAV